MLQLVAKKHNFDYHKYTNKWYGLSQSDSHYAYNRINEEKWQEEHYPIIKEFRENPLLPQYSFNQKGLDFYNTQEGKEFFVKVDEEYRKSPTGQCKELKYMNFWHTITHNFEITNNCLITINWSELLEDLTEPWEKQCCQLYVDEYGSEEYLVHVAW